MIWMSIEIAPSLGQVALAPPNGESDRQVVESHQRMAKRCGFGPTSIFVECDIAAIVQAILHAPMTAVQLQ